MRQSGILAAACLYALDNHLEQLHNDHRNARMLAELLTKSSRVAMNLATVQTNIVIFDLIDGPDAPALVTRCERVGVRFFDFGPRTVRLVTHRDISTADCEQAAKQILASLAP